MTVGWATRSGEPAGEVGRTGIGGIMPLGNSIGAGDGKAAGTEPLVQAREGEMIGLGTPGGTATVDGTVFRLWGWENQLSQSVGLVPGQELR